MAAVTLNILTQTSNHSKRHRLHISLSKTLHKATRSLLLL